MDSVTWLRHIYTLEHVGTFQIFFMDLAFTPSAWQHWQLWHLSSEVRGIRPVGCLAHLLLMISPPKKALCHFSINAPTSGPLHGRSRFVFTQISEEFEQCWIAFPKSCHRSWEHASPSQKQQTRALIFLGLWEKNEYRGSMNIWKWLAPLICFTASWTTTSNMWFIQWMTVRLGLIFSQECGCFSVSAHQ